MRLWRRLRFLFERGRFGADLAEEMRLHTELRAAWLREHQGAGPEEAQFAARRRFGNRTLLQEASRELWGWQWFEDFFQDLRLAGRQMRKTPGFAAVAVITLALGIGANTAIFTLINAVLLKSLPVRDPGKLVLFGEARGSGTSVGESGSFTLYSYDLYRHLAATNLFDGLCALQSSGAPISIRRAGSSPATSANAKLVSGNYFQVLGVNAVQGRSIIPSDDSASAPLVAVVSHRYWEERLDGNPSIIGSTIDLNRVPVSIIGVAPPGFYGEELRPDPPSFWLPLSAMRRLAGQLSILDDPQVHWLYIMGRLRPSVSVAQAQTRLTAALQNWLAANEPWRRRDEITKSYIQLTPGGGGIPHMQQASSQMLQLLLGLAGVVLLITCANIANLLLARGAARRGEYSVRLALGASRGRLVRQSLTESLVIALGGGVLGLLAARWATRVLIALIFRGTDYLPIQTAPDSRVLAFTFALSCVAALVSGWLPALRLTSGIALAIRSTSPAVKGSALSSHRLGKALVAGEVALSLVVLAMAGLFARSLANLAGQQFGFDREHVLVVNIDPSLAGYSFNRLGPLYQRMYRRLNSLPGVKSASFSYYSPFNQCCWGFTIAAEGFDPKLKPVPSALLNRVSPRYFETIGTKIVLGQAFAEHDMPPSRREAVVNEAFARVYWPSQNPIGRRFRIGGGEDADDIEVVGVVENAEYDNPREDPRAMAFLPLLQVKPSQSARQTGEYGSNFIKTIEVRSAAEPGAVAGEVRRALAEIDPNLPVLRLATVSYHIGNAVSLENLIADLSACFGLLALTLACVGLYGLMAYAVERRTSEIGVRIALGARGGTVIRMVIGEVLVQGAIGILLGVPAAFAAVRLVANLLYHVSPADPKYSIAAALALLVSLTAAGYLPARRAARIDPLQALRQE